MKSIRMSSDARQSIKSGIDKLADLVKCTIGPKGRNIIISKNYGKPIITNDGVTIAKQVQLEDQFEDLGARICRQVAQKTNQQAGDGTTTATILAQAIVNQGNKHILNGVNSIFLQRALEKYGNQIVKYIKSNSTQISNQKQIQNIASISANNDKQIGEVISIAIKQSGIQGVINIEDSKTMQTWVQRVQGMQINNGFISPYFVTDNIKMEVQLEDAFILVYNSKIFALNDLLNILKRVAQKGSSLLILAQDVQGQALATLVINKVKGILNVCAVKLPGLGQGRKEIAGDICAVTGAQYLSKQIGTKIEQVTLSQLGFAKKVIVGTNTTIIRQGEGEKDKIEQRVATIKYKMDKAKSHSQIERYQKRIAKIIDGVSVIHIGAQTQMQLKQKKFRMQDALNATRAAIQEGIVTGAGTTLARASYNVEFETQSKQEQIAIDILKHALRYPLKQIILNSGLTEQKANQIIYNVGNNSNVDMGFNALTCDIENLKQQGVIDPVKVVRCALENAVSISSLFLTTEGIILEHRSEQSRTQQNMFNQM